MFVVSNGTIDESGTQQTRENLLQSIVSILYFFLGLYYFGSMHAKTGQTYGKKAAKTKVVLLSGSPITSGAAYARAFWFLGPWSIAQVIMSLTMFLAGGEADLKNSENAWIAAVGAAVVMAGGLYGLVNVIVALLDKQQRAIHDKLAGTGALCSSSNIVEFIDFTFDHIDRLPETVNDINTK